MRLWRCVLHFLGVSNLGLPCRTTCTNVSTITKKSTSSKQSLIEDNVWRARLLASRMHSRYPRLDADELRSVALLALVESERTWNPQCASFSTWSGRRIEWALVDYIRLQRRHIRIQERPVVSIDDPSAAAALQISDERPDPEFEATKRILTRWIARAVKQLRAPAPDILKLYYVEGWTLRRIGKALQMSESRVSQIHADAVARLKHRFGYRLRGARPGTVFDSELVARVRHVGGSVAPL